MVPTMRLAFIILATIACQQAGADADFLACYASVFLPQIYILSPKTVILSNA